MSQAAANIDFLSSIPAEVLQASGPHGEIYALQLECEQAERHLNNLMELLYERYHDMQREAGARGGFGPLASSVEWVERQPEVIEQRAKVNELRGAVAEAHARTGGIVFLPATQNLPEIEKRLAALNRKAGKIGTETITLTVSDERLVLHYKTSDEDTRGYDFEHVFAVLSGATPKIPGFEFLATITPTEQGNVVKRIPPMRYGITHNLDIEERDSEGQRRVSGAQAALEAIDLSRFHSTGEICEHCLKVRQRSDLFVVYNEQSGETKQVGRNCLRDFTGLNNPEKVLKVLEQVQEFMRYAARGGESPDLPTEDFLTHCATIMRVKGGYERGLGHEARRNWIFWLYQTRDRDNKPMWVEPTAFDRAEAEGILAWLKEWDEQSEFATNVKLSLAGEVMNPKLQGYGGAVFIARQKWIATAAQRAERAEREAAREAKVQSGQHIGTVGQRETFTLTVTDIKWIPDPYGYGDDPTKPLLIMTDAEGNEVKWFASNLPIVADKAENSWPERGGTYQVKATVKRHEESEKWGKSTILTRCKFEKTIHED